MIDFVGKRRWFFFGSGLAILIALVSLALFGLQPGIDFTGGTSMTLHFQPQIEQEDLRQQLAEHDHPEAVIQRTDDDFFIRMKEISPDERQELMSSLENHFGSEVTVRDYNTVSPVIATETARNAGIAVAVAAVAMLLYIAWAFRRMPSPFRWGTCAIVALAHNVLIVMGLFSLLGKTIGVEINTLFITGLLTIVGYSINNTVVIFDRIRENMVRLPSPDFALTVNSSLVQTLVRSLNTSLTTLCVILALLLFGGATIYYFVLVLFVGVLVGTYSATCLAGPLLVVWEKGQWRELIPGLAQRPTSA
jgi:preprotein translocase subunit SecF